MVHLVNSVADVSPTSQVSSACSLSLGSYKNPMLGEVCPHMKGNTSLAFASKSLTETERTWNHQIVLWILAEP